MLRFDNGLKEWPMVDIYEHYTSISIQFTLKLVGLVDIGTSICKFCVAFTLNLRHLEKR